MKKILFLIKFNKDLKNFCLPFLYTAVALAVPSVTAEVEGAAVVGNCFQAIHVPKKGLWFTIMFLLLFFTQKAM